MSRRTISTGHLVAALLLAAVAVAVKPMDLPCVTWIKWYSYENTPDPSTLFVAARTYLTEYSPSQCNEIGDVMPCFAETAENWGHHDYLPSLFPADGCHTWVNGSVTLYNTFYLPQLGPKYQTWRWVPAQTGGAVPDNAIRFGPSVMARNTVQPPGQCIGVGFTGWAVGLDNGTFGDVHFSVYQQPFTTDTFEVAVCEAYHPNTTLVPTTQAPTTAVPPTTQAPATPVPTFSPTLPPNNQPYIRFGNTIASDHAVTATITQGSTSYTWTDYKFGMFSKWVEAFASGEGVITIYDAATGSQLLQTSIPLPAGPLVVVTKDSWPPSQPYNVETIAASYNPPATGSGVRLFNLSPDTEAADMSSGGTTLATDVKYTLGSRWASIPVSTASYTVTNHKTGATLATDSFTAPPAPFVFTNFLIGMANSTDSKYTTQLVALVDAPET